MKAEMSLSSVKCLYDLFGVLQGLESVNFGVREAEFSYTGGKFCCLSSGGKKQDEDIPATIDFPLSLSSSDVIYNT